MSTAYVGVPAAERATGRQAGRLLWQTSRPLALATLGWVIGSALMPALVVIALGTVVGAVPSALRSGLDSAAGTRLIVALVVAALVYGTSSCSTRSAPRFRARPLPGSPPMSSID